MSRLAAIETKKTVKPVRVLIYGIEGSGKTTFGSKAPKPIFISPEGGTDELEDKVPEMPNVKTWTDVIDAVKELITGKHDFKTLVLDSADWIEKLCHAHIIGTTTKSITTVDGGYGAGYRKAEIMHRELIGGLLTELREKRDMNIIVTAHYQVKTVKDPDAIQDYDQFEIKCHDFVSSLWREWVDSVLFVRFKTFMKKDDDKDKGRAVGTGERIVFTEKRPAFQAKNRYSLPPEMDFTKNFWNDFINAAGKGPVTDVATIKKEMEEVYERITDENIKTLSREHAKKVGDDPVQLTKLLARMKAVAGAA